jgi:hypothetical protein
VHDYGLSTAFYASKTRLQICDRSYNAVNGAADTYEEDNGRDKIDFSSVIDTSGVGVANLVNTLLQNLNSSTPTNYSFLHISEPDLTGHASGWGSANWSNAVRMVDGQVGRILDALMTNPVLSNSAALIVTADHGGIGNSHTDATRLTNYTIPFFLWSPQTPAGTDIYSLFSNRGNPGTNRVSYSVVPQPLRNADGGNIGLALLGLPPIPGSFSVPVFGATNVVMNIARGTNGTHTLWWDGNANAFMLECTPALRSAESNVWQTISEGIVENGGVRTYSVTNLASAFYRLRKL